MTKQRSSEFKHFICRLHSIQPRAYSFRKLASLAGGGVTASTIYNWYRLWDGSADSLKHKSGAGRAPLLNRAQVSRHILPRIRAANRRHEAIHYPTVLAQVRDSTGVQIAPSTLRKYGAERGVRKRRTVKRTKKERKITHSHTTGQALH